MARAVAHESSYRTEIIALWAIFDVFGQSWPTLWPVCKPFSGLNTSLRPQKSSMELISGKRKRLELANSLLLPHMGMLAVMRPFFVVFGPF